MADRMSQRPNWPDGDEVSYSCVLDVFQMQSKPAEKLTSELEVNTTTVCITVAYGRDFIAKRFRYAESTVGLSSCACAFSWESKTT